MHIQSLVLALILGAGASKQPPLPYGLSIIDWTNETHKSLRLLVEKRRPKLEKLAQTAETGDKNAEKLWDEAEKAHFAELLEILNENELGEYEGKARYAFKPPKDWERLEITKTQLGDISKLRLFYRSRIQSASETQANRINSIYIEELRSLLTAKQISRLDAIASRELLPSVYKNINFSDDQLSQMLPLLKNKIPRIQSLLRVHASLQVDKNTAQFGMRIGLEHDKKKTLRVVGEINPITGDVEGKIVARSINDDKAIAAKKYVRSTEPKLIEAIDTEWREFVHASYEFMTPAQRKMADSLGIRPSIK